MRNDSKKKLLFFLLCNPNNIRTKYDIAKNVVGCHPSWVIKIFKELEGKRITEGVKVVDYRKLLEFYRKYFKQFKAVYFYVPNPDSLIKAAEEKKLVFAVTTYWGESKVSKFLFPSKLELYIDEMDLIKWTELMPSISGAVGKGNVTLFLANKDFLDNYSEKMKGFKYGRIVKLPQLAVDLLNEGGAAVQAAEMIIERAEVG